MGSGLGSVPLERLVHCVGELLQATIPGGFKIASNPVPLSEVEHAWPKDDSTRRTVFIVSPFGMITLNIVEEIIVPVNKISRMSGGLATA
jgi:hypothetical protein